MYFHRQKSDPKRLQHVLDCHNVTLAEWLLLAAMEHGWRESPPDLPRRVAEFSEERFGLRASEEECRAGLETCLRSGWLRVVDQHAADEIHSLLRKDPVSLPVPGEVQCRRGAVDFTPCGAILYRMIAAEWLGPDWEDNLLVEKEYYREEHRYCEAEEGFRGVVQELADEGRVVQASRVVSIGPWCVYWWERFSAGYRMALQIGEPC
jgi:hypothetical protein